jgi:hypothetical protein
VADPSLGPICFLISVNKSPAHHSIFRTASRPAQPVSLLGLFGPVAGLSREISPRDEFTDLIFLRVLVSVFVAGHFGSIGERVSVASAPVLASSPCST